MNERNEQVLISTTALRAEIAGADVAPDFITIFMAGLERLGVFAEESIDPAQLGQAVGRLLAEGTIVISVDLGMMFGKIYQMKQVHGTH